MAETIKISLDTSKYRKPSQEDIRSAKQFVLQREEMALLLSDRVDEILSDAAERIVVICYKYGVDPKNLYFGSGFNEQMMNEISAAMDELEEEILDLIYEYSTRVTDDRDSMNALLLWMATLGRGNRNLRDTLDTYLYKTMKDWEAAIAAMMYMGVKQTDAITRIKTYLHQIYDMPEVRTAIRNKQRFTATYIRLGGVQPGAVGISNNGSTNVVNMSKITLQMAWMRQYVQDMKSDEDIAGVYILRGSTFDCPLCDENVGFHTIDEAMRLLPVHAHCKCYCVPVYLNEDIREFTKDKLTNVNKADNVKKTVITEEFRQRRKEIKNQAQTLKGIPFSNTSVEWTANISGAGIDEWLNQPHKHIREKNEALLNLRQLFEESEYIGHTPDPKNRADIANSHIFRTTIGGDDSWIIVNEMRWGEYKIYSVSDVNPIKRNAGN